MTLEPGDLLFTGTPAGVGAVMNPRRYLKPGDIVRCEMRTPGRDRERRLRRSDDAVEVLFPAFAAHGFRAHIVGPVLSPRCWGVRCPSNPGGGKRAGQRRPFPATAHAVAGWRDVTCRSTATTARMTLDRHEPKRHEIVKRLVASADVVVVNLPVKAPRRDALDYESFKAVKPDIVLTLATGYGRQGPYSGRVGFDAVGQAMCGSMRTDVRSGGGTTPSLRVTVGGFHDGAALCLWHGACVDGSCEIGPWAGRWRARCWSGPDRQQRFPGRAKRAAQGQRKPAGDRSQVECAIRHFPERDGWIVAAVVGQPLFVRWAKLMGEGGWLTDPRFRDDASRAEHSELLSERMGPGAPSGRRRRPWSCSGAS